MLKEEQEKIKSLIEALKDNYITEELGYAIEILYNAATTGGKSGEMQKGRDAVEAAMKNLQTSVEKSRVSYDQLMDAIEGAIAEADKGLAEDMHALKNALLGFCENLQEMEDVDNSSTASEQTILAVIEAGFTESTADIIEAVEDIKDLQDTIEEIEKELEDMQDEILGDIENSVEDTFEEIEKEIEDIAGIRIICQFVEDIYKVVEIIHNRTDMKVKSEKDYISNEKDSG
jgi:(p)ppGpp synthase/HD superfamily hydrolase